MSKGKNVKTNAMRIVEANKINAEFLSYEDTGFADAVTIAEKLGQPAEMTFKTLVTISKSKTHYVFVIPASSELDLKKAAKVVGEKSIEMLPLSELLSATGYIRGGCSPIGMKKQFRTVIHSSAEAFDRIMFSGGRRGSQVKMAPRDLADLVGAEFADITV